MKHQISHFYNALKALLEQVQLLHQAWCETQKVHQVQRKQIDSHKVYSKCSPGRQMCVCAAYFPDTETVLPQQKSQLHDVRGLPLPIDGQVNQFLAKFIIFFISLHFQVLSSRRAP